MIVTLNWLKEFVDIDLPAAELAHLLTMLGLEVERMEMVGAGLDDVVVARVLEKVQHPNADKLSLCKVDNGREVLNIVCGAQNFKEGDTVALAQIGATLPGDFKIKKSKIRGEESYGMLCSERELGLSEESAGILILPPEFQVGRPLLDALGLKDTIFEIGLTPNRADCLSVIGIAREIAAKTGRRMKIPVINVAERGGDINASASVVVEDADLCPRYTARYVSGCTIAPSPLWLTDRLKSAGIRSINNVVDITNYVLLEYGHPLHAFDFHTLAGGTIIVKRAGEGEKFRTLDGQERILNSSDLTIRDGERVVALAGIMGGENSEISSSTTNILLESAYFNPTAVRLTSKRLGLHTESSHRFERGTDINIVPVALDRAASLIAELSGGTVAKGIIDTPAVAVEPRTITARLERINSILGTSLSSADASQLLRRLELVVAEPEPGVFKVEVPTFRVDLEREIDIVEEVARLYGFERIPTTMPVAQVISDRPTHYQRMETTLRNLLVAHGFNEVVNFSFSDPSFYDMILLHQEDPRRTATPLKNPLVDEQSIMRTTLLPGLLETVGKNLNHRITTQRIFELRRVYLPAEGKELPEEPLVLAGAMTGLRAPEQWNQKGVPVDFFDVKGVLENILEQLNITGLEYATAELPPYLHPGKACHLLLNREPVGSFGEIHPTVQVNFAIEKPVYYFEIKFEKLVAAAGREIKAHAPSRFPDTFRDSAMLVDLAIPVSDIIATVCNLRIKEAANVEIFDVYQGENIPAGKKSIAIRVIYRSFEKTLTDEEVARLHARVVDNLVKKLNVSIR